MNPNGKQRSASAIRKAEKRAADLFGQVPVSHHDVYAWLLAVPQIDPESYRAAQYVAAYAVVKKIAHAKVECTFDELTAGVRAGARYRELVDRGASNDSVLFATPVNLTEELAPQLSQAKPFSPWRPKAVRDRERREKAARRGKDASLLTRLPNGVPSLSKLLAEIGNPAPHHLAKAMHVPVRTAQRWIREDIAPHGVMLALFWLTKWGVAMIHCDAHNDAMNSGRVAALRGDQIESLRQQIAHIERIADFGSANDPAPSITANRRLQNLFAPNLPGAATESLSMSLPTTRRSAPCADSRPKRKNG